MSQPSGRVSPPPNSYSQDISDGLKTAELEVKDSLLGARATSRTPVIESAGNPVYPILAYCGASIMMTVVNKYVVSGAHFDMNFLLLTIQSAVCVGAVFAAKAMGIITFRDFDMKDAKIWFPISALLVTVIYTGSKSLQHLSIPAYTVLKNGAIILTAYGEVLWFGGKVTNLTICSFGLMILSSLVASWPELSKSFAASPTAVAAASGSDTIGYFWMAINCVATATYLLTMRKRIKLTGFKDWDSMMYNNLLSIPILIVASILFEDWGSASLNRNFPSENRNFLLFAIAFSGAAAVFISYSTAWCIRVTSSTTYSMVGALNKLPIAASGMIFFSDPVNFTNVTSVLVGFFAGLVYSAAKNEQAKEARARAATDIPLHNTDRR
ncbi:gdp-mannose transporter [Phaffia rhodozyma]|uniref:GDP-mannose transporter n=1 Tax=Phaffia rhodozyma TaxID=264483 RepID=A0A0F7SI83_PHARH|nr:gdp-mannose transporter [Phaffia rhodozyma]